MHSVISVLVVVVVCRAHKPSIEQQYHQQHRNRIQDVLLSGASCRAYGDDTQHREKKNRSTVHAPGALTLMENSVTPFRGRHELRCDVPAANLQIIQIRANEWRQVCHPKTVGIIYHS